MNAESDGTVRLAGYQGEHSVHTRAMLALAERLRGLPAQVEFTADVTATGASARSLFDSVERGAGYHIAYAASGYFSARVPSLDVLDLPFSVIDRARALAALDGEAGRRLAGDIATATGLHVLGFWDNGFRHLSNRLRPVRSAADCRGLRVRTLDSALYQETLRAMGCVPIVTDVRELRSAVASGAVDGQENPLTNLINFEIWRYHPFVSLTGHFFGVALLLCNAAWFSHLTPHARNTLEEAVAEATHAQRLLAAQEDAACLAALTARSIAVLQPAELDLAGFSDACANVVRRRIDCLDAGLVAAYLG